MKLQDTEQRQQRLINEIRRVAAMLGVNHLSQREFDRHHAFGGVSSAGYQFGSWNRAVIAAGLEPNPPGNSNEPVLAATDLLFEILRLEKELGKAPSERELSRFGKFSLSPYRDRWGTLRNAKAAAVRLRESSIAVG